MLSFENENDKTSFLKYYISSVEIKYFNVLTGGKSFFDVPIKSKCKEETNEANIEMSKNSDYTTGNLLDYEYFSKHYKLITIDLSNQIELEDPYLKQQINFLGKLEDDNNNVFHH